MRRLLPLLLALAASCTGGDSPSVGVAEVSGRMPVVSGPLLAGDGSFSSEDRRGDVLVVNFWNPYCAPCRVETPILELASGRLQDQGVTIIGALFANDTFPHDLAAARRFQREFGVMYPSIDDPEGELAKALGVPGIPTTVIADGQGEMRCKVYGALRSGELERLVRRVKQTTHC